MGTGLSEGQRPSAHQAAKPQKTAHAKQIRDIFVAHSATMGKLNRDFEPLKMATLKSN